MCDILFENVKCRGCDSKLNGCLCRNSRPKGFLNKVLSEENICAGILFLINLNSVILHEMLSLFVKKYFYRNNFSLAFNL